MTRPSKPVQHIPKVAPTQSDATVEQTLAAHLVPPDTLKQLAEWRAKVTARFSNPPTRKATPKKKP